MVLDLSSAFDTTDHQILINRLREKFGITGTVFTWFVSYQKVIIGSTESRQRPLTTGVPQGLSWDRY